MSLQQLSPAAFGELSLPGGQEILRIMQPMLSLDRDFLQNPKAYADFLSVLSYTLRDALSTKKIPMLTPNITVKPPVWLAHGTTLHPGTVIEGPCVIGEGSVVGPTAFLRPGTIIGENVRIGFGVETKCSVIANGGSVAHLSYVGHTMLGQDVMVGAGCMFSTRRLDDEPITLATPHGPVVTQHTKFGSVVEREVRIGVGVMIMPGTWVGSGTRILPGKISAGYLSTVHEEPRG